MYYLKYEFRISRYAYTSAKFTFYAPLNVSEYLSADRILYNQLKEELDAFFLEKELKKRLFYRAPIVINDARYEPAICSRLKIVSWDELTDSERYETIAGSFFKEYLVKEQVDNIIKNVVDILEKLSNGYQPSAIPFHETAKPEPETVNVIEQSEPESVATEPEKPAREPKKAKPRKPRNRIDYKTAYEAYYSLMNGNTQKKVAKELNFAECLFRRNYFLQIVKDVVDSNKGEEELRRLLITASANAKEGTLKSGNNISVADFDNSDNYDDE